MKDELLSDLSCTVRNGRHCFETFHSTLKPSKVLLLFDEPTIKLAVPCI